MFEVHFVYIWTMWVHRYLDAYVLTPLYLWGNPRVDPRWGWDETWNVIQRDCWIVV